MKKIFYSALLALTVAMGFSFASTDESFIDLTLSGIMDDNSSTDKDKEKVEAENTISQEMLDSINARLSAKNLEVMDKYRNSDGSSSSSADEPINIRTGMRSAKIHKQEGILHGVASYYHDKFVGRKTANGEIFSQNQYTCACNSLPLGTYLRVTNKKNGKEVVVKVNDRLAKYNKRVVDLSKCSARKIGSINDGIAKVKVEIIDPSEGKRIINSY